MSSVVNVNGQVTDGTVAKISVFDHGFLFGEGVYETIRTYRQKPFIFERHMERLRASADRIDLPVPLSDDGIRRRIDDTLAALPGPGERYIRVLLTRGVGALSYDPASCPEPSLVIVVKPLEEVPDDVLRQGVKIVVVPIIRNHPASVNPLIKSNNLLNNALAMQQAMKHGGVEGLMRNHRGELAECSQSNFFIVRDGEALTPPLSAGLLAGLTRQLLLELGPTVGVPVREHVLTEADLPTAAEAFFTSTTKELLPVVRIDDLVVGNGLPGPITRRLLNAFRRAALTQSV